MKTVPKSPNHPQFQPSDRFWLTESQSEGHMDVLHHYQNKSAGIRIHIIPDYALEVPSWEHMAKLGIILNAKSQSISVIRQSLPAGTPQATVTSPLENLSSEAIHLKRANLLLFREDIGLILNYEHTLLLK